MITVITGVLLAGKSTLANFLKDQGYEVVLEYTTRPRRKGEKDGVDYHFVDDDTFDKMLAAGEFVESFKVDTVFGTWKYGCRREDLENAKTGSLLVCGGDQMRQLLDSGIPMLSVLLKIDEATAKERASKRGDNPEEFNRRFTKDSVRIEKLYKRVDMVLDAADRVEVNARHIDNRLSLIRMEENKSLSNISTAQKMYESEKYLYLEGDQGLRPYLRMREKGMPNNPVNQIAWLLLCGSGCGFCKVCRDKPCGIKDGEKCTDNIADYIRECVHMEDEAKKNESGHDDNVESVGE